MTQRIRAGRTADAAAATIPITDGETRGTHWETYHCLTKDVYTTTIDKQFKW